MSKTNFREDINGLRAWAVVSVILFHFGVAGFSGGFVGVDIFFVISGFLMTGIIVGSLEKHATIAGARKFSVMDFYIARAKRIIPALLALCAVLLGAGWFCLSPADYKTLGTHSVAALGFFSNIMFWREAGYFDVASHEKLLLHTWSLSVEWQFYMILPLVLLAVWKLFPTRKAVTITVAIGFLSSLLLSIVISPATPSAAFYLIPTRAWEMLAGGLVYLTAHRFALSTPVRRNVELCGFALIIGSVLIFDANSVWPGWHALVPVGGTMFVLIAARQGSLWTATRTAQWLGNCSYSLYLWHWPLAVGLVYLDLQHNSEAVIISLLLTLLLGWLSYRLVENPSRRWLSNVKAATTAGAIAVASLAVALPGVTIRLLEGMPGRLPANVEAVFAEENNINPRREECHASGTEVVPGCTYGGPVLGAIVIGDSHAAALIRSVEKALPDKQQHALEWSMASCRTIEGVKNAAKTSDCGNFVRWALEEQQSLPADVPLIIINRLSSMLLGRNDAGYEHTTAVPSEYLSSPHSARTQQYFDEMRQGIIDTACKFAKTRPVYMVRPTPELIRNVPKTMGRALIFGRDPEVAISIEAYRERNALAWDIQDTAAKKCGIKLLDPLPYLCNEGRCRGDKDGLPIYYDDDHLNERGGSLLVPMFQQVFREAKEVNDRKSAGL